MVISSGSNGMNYLPMSSGSYPNGAMINAPGAPTNLSNLGPSPYGNSGVPLQSLCCLVENGQKCNRPSGNASYSKRIEKQVVQRKLRLAVDPRSSHSYICEHHKQIIQSIRASGKRKRKDEDNVHDDEMAMMNEFHDRNDSGDHYSGHSHHHHNAHHATPPYGSNSALKPYSSSNSFYDIDLHSLQVNTLRRYKRHFRISTKPGLNKTQLAEEISRHFRTIVVNEKDVINNFMYTVKSNANKLDFTASSKNND